MLLHIATNFEFFFVTFSKSIFWKLYTPNILENNYKTRVMVGSCHANGVKLCVMQIQLFFKISCQSVHSSDYNTFCDWKILRPKNHLIGKRSKPQNQFENYETENILSIFIFVRSSESYSEDILLLIS